MRALVHESADQSQSVPSALAAWLQWTCLPPCRSTSWSFPTKPAASPPRVIGATYTPIARSRARRSSRKTSGPSSGSSPPASALAAGSRAGPVPLICNPQPEAAACPPGRLAPAEITRSRSAGLRTELPLPGLESVPSTWTGDRGVDTPHDLGAGPISAGPGDEVVNMGSTVSSTGPQYLGRAGRWQAEGTTWRVGSGGLLWWPPLQAA